MAESKAPGKVQKADPTVKSTGSKNDPGYPEGTHPPHPLAEVDWSAKRFSYSDNTDDGVDPDAVAQLEEPSEDEPDSGHQA